jgi:hypothetical protein
MQKHEGALVLVTDHPGTVKTLQITGLDLLMPVRRTLGEALVEAEHSVSRGAA